MNNKVNIRSLGFGECFFLLGLFMKQFYLKSSGSVQIGDVLMFSSALFILFKNRMPIEKIDYSFIIFVLFTYIINSLYFIYYGEGFLRASFYFLYNLIIVIAFRTMSKKQNFTLAVFEVMKCNLIVQFLVLILGFGRYMYNGSRYQGTFNDPNQFGFFVLSSVFIMYLISIEQEIKIHAIWMIMLGLFVIICSSMGMTLAYLVFLMGVIIVPIFDNQLKKADAIKAVLFFILIVVIFFYWRNIVYIIEKITNWDRLSYMIERITQKIGKMEEKNVYGENLFIRDRLLLRTMKAPYFFIFGCGEGGFQRFITISHENNEIHSTMLALCYYYGLIPYYFFLKWIHINLKRIPYRALCVYTAIILEAFTLANHRQPYFWILFVLGSMIKKDKKYQKVNGVDGNAIND